MNRCGSRGWRSPSSFVRSRSTRRTATVTTSAPDASIAAIICAFDAYFPVPTNSRERNSRPPMMNGVSSVGSRSGAAVTSPSSDEMHDLQHVTLAEHDRRVRVAIAQDGPVVLDHDEARIELQRGEIGGERGAWRNPARVTVDLQRNGGRL